jgi:hypothetical protein
MGMLGRILRTAKLWGVKAKAVRNGNKTIGALSIIDVAGRCGRVAGIHSTARKAFPTYARLRVRTRKSTSNSLVQPSTISFFDSLRSHSIRGLDLCGLYDKLRIL